MTPHSMHHPKADIHCLYLPRSNRGRGRGKGKGGGGCSFNSNYLIKHWQSVFLILDFIRSLDVTSSFKHEKEKGSRSVVNKAKKIVQEIDLDLETKLDGEMTNTELLGNWKELLRKRETRLLILPRSQNHYTTNAVKTV